MMNNPTERDKQITREAAEACSAHAYAKYGISGVDTCYEFYREILAAIQDAHQQGNETPTVILGFASWKDGSFELIVRDDEQGEETTLKGHLEQGQFEQVSKILPTCVFVPARCQQGNEDTARALKRFGQHAVNCGDDGKCTCGLDAAIDAARGVQPAAKEEKQLCQDLSKVPAITEPAGAANMTDADAQNRNASAAQQESAPAAEQEPRFFVGQVMSCQHGPPDNIFHFRVTELGKDGTPNRMELVPVAPSPAQSAPAAEQGWPKQSPPLIDYYDPRAVRIRNAISVAPSPAQDKPVAASLRRVVKDALIDAQNQIIGFARERNPKVEQALELLSSSPSEQKSSLPAETLSAQEQESQETGSDWREWDLLNWIERQFQHEHDGRSQDLCSRIRKLREQRSLSPDAPRPTGSSVAPPKSESAASAATPKENQ